MADTNSSELIRETSAFPTTSLGSTGETRNMTGGALSWCWWRIANGGDEDQPDGQIAAAGIALLEQVRSQPFFIALGFNKPHDPFVAPSNYFSRYPLTNMVMHVDPPDKSPEVSLALPAGGTKAAFDAFTDQERREFLRAYHSCTTFVDAQMGKVLDAMDRLGLWENTIVVLLSDHGYHLGERGWWNKVTVFELCARVPMMVYVPHGPGNGQRTRGLVEYVDLYPTLTELAGLLPPPGLAGQSFAALLNDPLLPGKPAAYTQVLRGTVMGRSVRTAQWRYTEWGGGSQGVELYDHDTDPGEWYNLAGKPEYASIIAGLQALLTQ